MFVCSAGVFVWHGAATTVVMVLPVGICSWCLMPNATGSPPFGTLSASETVSPGPSTNADDGMFAEPGDGAAADEQRGITTVRADAPSGSATATTPGTLMIDVAFCSFTTAFGEHGGTTTVRMRSPAGRSTAREPSVLNGFGFDLVLRMPTTANTAIITPM